LPEDLGLLFLRQILENRYRVVGFQVAHAFRHLSRRHFVEDFIAHRVVDLGERAEIEVDAEQFDQAWALLGIERFQQRALVGFVQIAGKRA